MIQALLRKKNRKRLASVMLTIMVLEIVCPNISYALSSGPVQPEIQSFEPVGTTDMVDMFTGDFVYNIPLMDVEGYPINISYHGGVTMDQEASWVGLGWNISPGAVNRALRGLPDDFAGDTIEKEISIKPEVTTRLGLAANVEVAGIGNPYIDVGVNLGGYLTMSNYRGVSVDFTTGAGVNTQLFGVVSGGLNVGASLGSQTGASVNYNLTGGVGISKGINSDLNASGSFNLNTGGTYSPRTGLRRNVGFSVGAGVSTSRGSFSTSTGANVQIANQNYSAAVTNASYMNSFAGHFKLGGEVFGLLFAGDASGSVTNLWYDQVGSRKGYGYFNLDKAGAEDLLDFSREKDGTFNTTMFLLPQTHLTYDVYGVSGQGTGGSFRPFRNDIGAVYDPLTQSEQHSDNPSLEGGAGNLFNIGGEYTETDATIQSGRWDDYKRPFTGKDTNNPYYEGVYFKEAGELTQNNETYLNSYGNTDPIKPEDIGNVPTTKPDANTRVVRANHIYTRTYSLLDSDALISNKQLISYKDSTGFSNYPNITKEYIPRIDNDPAKKLKRKPQQVTEIVQTQKDGRRYVYGLPVLNNVQREITFAVDTANVHDKVDMKRFLVSYNQNHDDNSSNQHGLDHFYSSTVTPTYVAAHLLTGVLSADYVDVTGDGISDDDLGTYTKFNYTRKSTDYRWRTPMEAGKAQFMPGYYSDRMDDKASVLAGSREQWMLHSIETRNYVAEFYVSPRKDAMGYADGILGAGVTYTATQYQSPADPLQNVSYKLDSIVLYNKYDRFLHTTNAQPIKTVLFTYDYSLCKKLPNAADPNTGKLTLKKIQIRYGTSNINLSAAYSFNYSSLNPDYDIAAKDRWGFYKPNDTVVKNNFEFPYTNQAPGLADSYASAWALTDIKLPSGGAIKVDYEADDYAYVQDKDAREMFMVAGMGNSPNYDGGANELYFNKEQPNLYFYFKRRKSSENPLLSFKDNYMRDTNLMYYNIPVELKAGLYEPIKGYATVEHIGICADNDSFGYVQLSAKGLEGTSLMANPVTYAALNVGRYNLPHILFPGSDPGNSDINNIAEGLKSSLHELFGLAKSPLLNMINSGKAQETDLRKAFIRLTSPGLKKKRGGQRVKQISFYDNWNLMAAGNPAIYGKTYAYTIAREDGKGTISSGVASYEPMIGGDEIPQRLPVSYTPQQSTHFPPNDPVDLYQEFPIGESFFPSPVVGYRKVTVRSINIDKARSAQSEDISTFYTAKDFPTRWDATAINTPDNDRHISLTEITTTQESTQGFSLVFNDMHGKPRTTEHWVLKPDTTTHARELVNYQAYDYLTQNGQLSNMVPAFDYNAAQGKLQVTNKKMGIETDVTIDSRSSKSESNSKEVSANVNGFMVGFFPVVIGLGYPFNLADKTIFNCASVTKVTQQYGIISKVTSNNQGAITEVHNDVYDPQTGNVLVTSVNNQYGDREFTVNFPAYWGYRELGPSYENLDLVGRFTDTVYVDSLGGEALGYGGNHFINYNPAYSSHLKLPSNMPVARVRIDEEMPKFKVGDELLLYYTFPFVPVKFWVMGFSSDKDHCYLIMAPREPYKMNSFWAWDAKYTNLIYHNVRSGNRNRLGETIQSFTTTDSSDIYPYLKNDLTNLINLSATRYDHQNAQVYAANASSDSLNPFTTGKAGIYRPDRQVVNLTNRDYTSGVNRSSGIFNSAAYWKTEIDPSVAYCPDSVVYRDLGNQNTYNCPNVINSFALSYVAPDGMRVDFTPSGSCPNPAPDFLFSGYMGNNVWPPYTTPAYQNYQSHFAFQGMNPGHFVYHDSLFLNNPANTYHRIMYYSNGCCSAAFQIDFNYQTHDFTITNLYFIDGNGQPIVVHGTYTDQTGYHLNPLPVVNGGTPQLQPYRLRKKIMLGKVGHYDGTDAENWVNAQHITKYNWFGQELENLEDGIGYNSAVYGYNQQLPTCVAKNARQGEVLFESFEDYALLRPVSNANESYKPLFYSPFEPYLQTFTSIDLFYKLCNMTATGNAFTLVSDDEHSGNYALKTAGAGVAIPLNGTGTGMTNGYSFKMSGGKKYVASVWLRPTSVSGSAVIADYNASVSISMDTAINNAPAGAPVTAMLVATSPIIDGWQQYSATFDVAPNRAYFTLNLGANFYYDDLRIYPFASNSKGFVYHPVTRKLMATLDENNYATFYEYDAEGNLVRTKKETAKGILTVSESRSTHYKSN